jgi:hypothetical protein
VDALRYSIANGTLLLTSKADHALIKGKESLFANFVVIFSTRKTIKTSTRGDTKTLKYSNVRNAIRGSLDASKP